MLLTILLAVFIAAACALAVWGHPGHVLICWVGFAVGLRGCWVERFELAALMLGALIAATSAALVVRVALSRADR